MKVIYFECVDKFYFSPSKHTKLTAPFDEEMDDSTLCSSRALDNSYKYSLNLYHLKNSGPRPLEVQ